MKYSRNPTFITEKRPGGDNTSITVQGYMIEQPEKSTMLPTDADLKNEVVQFFSDQGVKIGMSPFH